MNPLRNHRTRRATTDDLPRLISLWEVEKLPAETLEKQLTDFQVVEDPEGVVVAAIALQVAGAHGRIHSETISDFGQADGLRAMLWQQLQNTSRSLGLNRLWTHEIPPFWRKDAGFAEPDAETLLKLPGTFTCTGSTWLTLRLREDAADPEALDRQFEMFKVTEQEKRNRIIRGAKFFAFLGTLFVVVLFLVAMIALLWVWNHRPH